MQLFIKNKYISLRGSSNVFDENDNIVYKVKGKFFTVTRKKFIQDLNENTLYMVRNKYWHWWLRSAYVYDQNGERVCQIKRRFSFKSNFMIYGSKDELRIDGNIIGWNFSIYKNNQLLGTIKRKFDFRDSFVLDIPNDEDAAFFVSIVIAIDNIVDAARNND